MSLISILLIATAILTVSAGLFSVVGSSKADRGRSIWLLASNIGAVVWAISIGIYLILPVDAESVAPIIITGIYTGAMLMSIALLGHMAWKYLWGKIATIFFAIWGLVLAV